MGGGERTGVLRLGGAGQPGTVRLGLRRHPGPVRVGLRGHAGSVRLRLGRDAGTVRLGLGDQAGAFGRAGRRDPVAFGLGLDGDQGGVGVQLGAAAAVGAALLDQVLFAAGQLDLALQLVLGDGALALDGHGAALVRGLVGVLLDRLAGRGLKGAFELGFGADRDHPGADHGHAGLVQARVAGQGPGDRVADGGHASGERLGQGHPGQQVQGRLLGQLGQQGGELVEGLAAPGAVVRVDGEVQAGHGDLGGGDPVRHGGLHGDVGEVGGPGVEQQR